MSKVAEWLGAAERKLDEHGKPAWIVAMVAGFILVWPVGLAILFYMIWSGRMGGKCNGWKRRMGGYGAPTGNAAFDEYREETLRRLEDEQKAFTTFLDQLRRAKDKAEFDQFMASRRGDTATA